MLGSRRRCLPPPFVRFEFAPADSCNMNIHDVASGVLEAQSLRNFGRSSSSEFWTSMCAAQRHSVRLAISD